ncbi:MAG: Na/Pi cotransporter family protein, partial [Chloroflexi bacterium]|nr:Na/Pi cotransporter family protein [Chloroflexota bacterium]
MPADLVLVYIFGGAFLLLYGMRLAGEGMQSLAGGRLRQMLSTLTNRRATAAASGAVATALLQSSSATTVMLVGLASSGY